jgi:hypothetical protein
MIPISWNYPNLRISHETGHDYGTVVRLSELSNPCSMSMIRDACPELGGYSWGQIEDLWVRVQKAKHAEQVRRGY